MTDERSTPGSQDVTPPWWRRVSIRTKLQASTFGFAFLILVVSAIALTWAANTYFHRKINQDLSMLAQVFAENLRASVTFDDKKSAVDTLSALEKNSHISFATVYMDGEIFAAFPNATPNIGVNARELEEGVWLRGDYYYVSVPISVMGEPTGQLVLVSDLEEWKQIRRSLYTLFIALFVMLFCLTLLFSVWLRKYISQPLSALSAWARGVSVNKDFSARAKKTSDDEIGLLADSLNEMLSELAKQKSVMSWNMQLQSEVHERKRIEQQLIEMRDRAEAAFQAKSRFLANMSHEIRTPMNAIIGFINIVLDGELNQNQRKQLETVKRSAKSLHNLLNDILDVAKLEQDKFELESIAFSARQVVDDVVDIFDIKAREQNIALRKNIAADVPQALLGDPFRLTQVLSNLIGNAIKFTHQGQVEVRLETQDQHFLKFAISDTGIGIPKDKHEHIFKSFGQADSSTSRQYGGTGLGTTISKQLVELMGGEIWFESKEGVGSTFYFTIKLTPADAGTLARAPAQDSSITTGLPSKKPLNILVAEDIIENAELLKVRLGGMGHKLVHAFNGREALEYFEKQDFDFILMDVHMPEVDGLTATKAIRATKRGEHIPILALSASVLREDRESCANAGMDGFVAKPIVFDVLFSEMARLLSLSSSDRDLEHPSTQSASEPMPSPPRPLKRDTFGTSLEQNNTQNNLPEVPGIDFVKAISVWQNEKSYVRNLQRFFSKHRSDVDAIRECLQSGNISAARQLIHGLHGVAGNLSLETLFKRLEALSLAISRKRDTEYDSLLNEISDALAEANNSVKYLCELYNLPPNGCSPDIKAHILEHIDEFDRKLTRGLLDDEMLQQLLQDLSHCGISQDVVDAISRSIEEFEFEQTIDLLSDAKRQITREM